METRTLAKRQQPNTAWPEAAFESLEPRLFLDAGEALLPVLPSLAPGALQLVPEPPALYAGPGELTEANDNDDSVRAPGDRAQWGDPDLYVESFEFSRYSAGPGQSVGDVLSLTIGNKGQAAVGAFSVGIYLSTNSIISTFDTLLPGGRRQVYFLQAGQKVEIPFAGLKIPTQANPGSTYYIGVLVDEHNDVQNEQLETNNTACEPVVITAANWTVMVFANGDNDLEWSTVKDLDEMEQVKLPQGKVSLLIQLDRHPGTDLDDGYEGWNVPSSDTSGGNWSDTRRGFVTYDGKWNPVLGQGTYSTKLSVADPANPELDMGDDDTLIDFVKWAMKTAPAQHYALVMSDHGGGWVGCSSDYTDASGAHDYEVSDLSMKEIRSALDAVGHLDVLGMDMCMMQQVEVATEMIGEVDYFVANPNSEGGFQYEPWLKWLAGAPAGSAQDLAKQMVAGQDWTAAALNMSKLPALNEALNHFASELLFSPGNGHPTVVDWSVIHAARNAAKYFKCWEQYRDLRAYMGYIAGGLGVSYHIRSAAQDALDAANDAILVNKGKGKGLTIYLPEPGKADGGYDATALTFADPNAQNGTRWRELLKNMPAASPPPTRLVNPIFLEYDPGDLIPPPPTDPGDRVGPRPPVGRLVAPPVLIDSAAAGGMAGDFLRIGWPEGRTGETLDLMCLTPTGWQRIDRGVPATTGEYEYNPADLGPGWSFFSAYVRRGDSPRAPVPGASSPPAERSAAAVMAAAAEPDGQADRQRTSQVAWAAAVGEAQPPVVGLRAEGTGAQQTPAPEPLDAAPGGYPWATASSAAELTGADGPFANAFGDDWLAVL